jgi:hypothetical protein
VTTEQELALVRAQQVCRRWANVRAVLLAVASHIPAVREFDEAMFRLGEVVWPVPASDDGSVARVDRGE